MTRQTVMAVAVATFAALPAAPPGVRGGPARPSRADRPASAPDVRSGRQTPDGKVLYLKHCRQCHGATGEPSAQSKKKYEKIPSLADAEFYTKRSDDSLRVVVEKGKGRDMKGFSDKLTKEEVGAVVEYMHSLPAKKGGTH